MAAEAEPNQKGGKGNLMELSKEELIKKIEQLSESNRTLRSQIKNIQSKTQKSSYKKPNQRPFDFKNCAQKKIALRIAYIGWDYQGFASQDTTDNTIEHEIFAALKKTCLIEDRESCDYTRCGRTDKGVSAFGQVISLKVRAGKANEKGPYLDYVKILNKVLPPDIKVLAWAPVSDDFNARSSCLTRTYKYFFPAAKLDVEVMLQASRKLLGAHDFRNFCKIDVGNNVNHFVRNIKSIDIRTCTNESSSAGFGNEMLEVTICGMAFLWHQVRCVVSVLFLIGLKLEEPEVIDRLLDVESCPKKPQYSMVSEIPLVLYDCAFESIDWKYEQDQLEYILMYFQDKWTDMAVRKALLERMFIDLQSHKEEEDAKKNFEGAVFPLMTGHRKRNYQPLMKRPVCEGIERHLEKQAVKRRRLEERYLKKKEQ